MAIERTLSIIKPDAVGKNHIGDIIARFEKAGLKPVAMKYKHLSQAAQGTIRADFAGSIDENAAHGSDSVASAEREIAYFFGDDEVYPRTR